MKDDWSDIPPERPDWRPRTGWQLDQIHREAKAFERLTSQLWGALQSQWRTDRAKSE